MHTRLKVLKIHTETVTSGRPTRPPPGACGAQDSAAATTSDALLAGGQEQPASLGAHGTARLGGGGVAVARGSFLSTLGAWKN